MKIALITIAFSLLICSKPAFAQQSTDSSGSGQLLSLYYSIKDALVKGQAEQAKIKAGEFGSAIGSLPANSLPEKNRAALLKDANAVSKAKDIKQQREHFASFSDHMFELAKVKKLSSLPIYKAYCPMKKSSWLSEETAIKNPYYGSAMLTCGEVVETLN